MKLRDAREINGMAQRLIQKILTSGFINRGITEKTKHCRIDFVAYATTDLVTNQKVRLFREELESTNGCTVAINYTTSALCEILSSRLFLYCLLFIFVVI